MNERSKQGEEKIKKNYRTIKFIYFVERAKLKNVKMYVICNILILTYPKIINIYIYISLFQIYVKNNIQFQIDVPHTIEFFFLSFFTNFFLFTFKVSMLSKSILIKFTNTTLINKPFLLLIMIYKLLFIIALLCRLEGFFLKEF